ncbi:DoxX family protein [Lentzea tibetensis]|uniref:DoxX family protein n=2 Tax=Lentzea tibetensis TaxID=2591470 RepID=A0A563ERE2_9PSEU|nr:DoxX family protein [Lentzea tibetensis]
MAGSVPCRSSVAGRRKPYARAMTIALSIVLALLFLATGAGKVLGVKGSLAYRDKFQMSAGLWRTIGVLEWAGSAGLIVGLFVSWIGIAATVGLGLLMVGATIVRLRYDSKPVGIVIDLVLLGLLIMLLFVER